MQNFHSIGILGGTFDPVHLGHLHLASEILLKANLDTILFIPCYQSAYGKEIIATPNQRLAMLKLAILENPKFSIDDREIKRKNISYTIDTIKSLHDEFPNSTLHLIMGFDALLQFKNWRDWQGILKLANLIVADRPDVVGSFDKIKDLPKNIIKINPLPISATKIRTLIKTGESAKHLLPEKVWRYIIENNLYH